jgi:hypothetical protein
MALNPNIILSGQPVDVIGSLSRGTQAAAQTNALRTQNDLASLYRTQGAGIMAGDQGALNALAGIDPMAAMGVQQTRQQMRISEEELRMSYENARLRGAELAAQMDDQTRQREAAALERGLAGAAFFYQRGDKAGYEGFLRENGLDPASLPFEAFPAHAAGVKGAMDALTQFAPPKPEAPLSSEGKLRADFEAGRIGQAEYEAGLARLAPTGTSISVDPATGGMTFNQGPGVTQPTRPFTEGQSKDNVYVTRARGALEKLEPVADALTSRSERLLEGVPLGIGREGQTEEFQVAKQAGDEFLQAVLRKDTGAAITAQEQVLYGETYLPQPGDGPAVLEAKREARQRAISAIEAGMSADQLVVTDQALVDSARAVESRSTGAGGGTRLRYNPETGQVE